MFRGSFVALVTPFSNGNVDETALKKLVDRQIDQGTQGIIAIGSAAESSTLSFKEHKRTLTRIVKSVDGKVPVIAAPELEFSLHADELGADAVLYRPGYDSTPGQAAPFRRFKNLYDRTKLKFIMASVEAHTVFGLQQLFAVDITPRVMNELPSLPRVAGIHDSSRDHTRVKKWRSKAPTDFTFLSGSETGSSYCNTLEGETSISALANITPALCAEMHSAWCSGDRKKAQNYRDRLTPLGQAISEESTVAGVKFALSLLGLTSDECRKESYPLSRKNRQSIATAMEELGIF